MSLVAGCHSHKNLPIRDGKSLSICSLFVIILLRKTWMNNQTFALIRFPIEISMKGNIFIIILEILIRIKHIIQSQIKPRQSKYVLLFFFCIELIYALEER